MKKYAIREGDDGEPTRIHLSICHEVSHPHDASTTDWEDADTVEEAESIARSFSSGKKLGWRGAYCCNPPGIPSQVQQSN